MCVILFPGRQETLLEIVFDVLNCHPMTRHECSLDCEFIEGLFEGLNDLLPDNIVEMFLLSHDAPFAETLKTKITIQVNTPRTTQKVSDLFEQIIRSLSNARAAALSQRVPLEDTFDLRRFAMENAAQRREFRAPPGRDLGLEERDLDLEAGIALSLAETGRQSSGLLPVVDQDEIDMQAAILLSMVLNQGSEPTPATAGKGKNRATYFGPGAGSGYGGGEDE